MEKGKGSNPKRDWEKELADAVSFRVLSYDEMAKLMEDAPGKAISQDVLSRALRLASASSQPRMVKAALAAGGQCEEMWLPDMARWLGKGESVEDWKACVVAMCGGDMGKLDLRVSYGYAGLHCALRDNHWEWSGAAMALLDLGADPWLATSEKESAAQLAVKYGHVGVYLRLKAMAREKGLDVSADMQEACESRNPAMVAQALAEGGDPSGNAMGWAEMPEDGSLAYGALPLVALARRPAGNGRRLAASKEGLPDGNPEILSMLLAAIEANAIRKSMGQALGTDGPAKRRPL